MKNETEQRTNIKQCIEHTGIYEGKQFNYYLQQKVGRKWHNIFKSIDSDEVLSLKEINETSGKKFRIVAKLEGVAFA